MILPRLLPEISPPDEVINCQKCKLSNQRTRIIWGEGSPKAALFVILDNPGAREDNCGQPFLCGTRETLLETAQKVGVKPQDMYISYILKCRPIRAYDKPEARKMCKNYLLEQIKTCNPKLLLILGDVAVQNYLDEPTAKVKKLRGKVHSRQNQRIIASYHPLAVRRRPSLKKYFLKDWELVASFLQTNSTDL